MGRGPAERLYVTSLAIALVACGALAIFSRSEPPPDVAKSAATLLTILGALGIGITLTRRVLARLGRRNPAGQWAPEFLFFTAGLGWGLFVPGAAALIALHGEPGPGSYLLVVALACITIMVVAAGGFLGFAFLLGEGKYKYPFLAVVHLPAVLFLSIALRLLSAAWRAI